MSATKQGPKISRSIKKVRFPSLSMELCSYDNAEDHEVHQSHILDESTLSPFEKRSKMKKLSKKLVSRSKKSDNVPKSKCLSPQNKKSILKVKTNAKFIPVVDPNEVLGEPNSYNAVLEEPLTIYKVTTSKVKDRKSGMQSARMPLSADGEEEFDGDNVSSPAMKVIPACTPKAAPKSAIKSGPKAVTTSRVVQSSPPIIQPSLDDAPDEDLDPKLLSENSAQTTEWSEVASSAMSTRLATSPAAENPPELAVKSKAKITSKSASKKAKKIIINLNQVQNVLTPTWT